MPTNNDWLLYRFDVGHVFFCSSSWRERCRQYRWTLERLRYLTSAPRSQCSSGWCACWAATNDVHARSFSWPFRGLTLRGQKCGRTAARMTASWSARVLLRVRAASASITNIWPAAGADSRLVIAGFAWARPWSAYAFEASSRSTTPAKARARLIWVGDSGCLAHMLGRITAQYLFDRFAVGGVHLGTARLAGPLFGGTTHSADAGMVTHAAYLLAADLPFRGVGHAFRFKAIVACCWAVDVARAARSRFWERGTQSALPPSSRAVPRRALQTNKTAVTVGASASEALDRFRAASGRKIGRARRGGFQVQPASWQRGEKEIASVDGSSNAW